eukprot:Blabericola_migrator_1__10568@NODE_5_length_29060_cov_171_088642_g4_i0_p18_GENE_NODE_5_length_29060_cov_171_088642_g4_i0NODE_5_length_29060_cov_171_088642_g4_i0_p18_ORF_typecomplete_len164_score18_44_NODE_5_length_29060_cov_171_088642_g4_i01130711798
MARLLLGLLVSLAQLFCTASIPPNCVALIAQLDNKSVNDILEPSNHEFPARDGSIDDGPAIAGQMEPDIDGPALLQAIADLSSNFLNGPEQRSLSRVEFVVRPVHYLPTLQMGILHACTVDDDVAADAERLIQRVPPVIFDLVKYLESVMVSVGLDREDRFLI